MSNAEAFLVFFIPILHDVQIKPNSRAMFAGKSLENVGTKGYSNV